MGRATAHAFNGKRRNVAIFIIIHSVFAQLLYYISFEIKGGL